MEGGDGDGFYLSVCLPNDKLIRRNVIEWLVIWGKMALLSWVGFRMQNRLIGWRSEASRDGYAMAVSLGGCCRDAIFPLWLC